MLRMSSGLLDKTIWWGKVSCTKRLEYHKQRQWLVKPTTLKVPFHVV